MKGSSRRPRLSRAAYLIALGVILYGIWSYAGLGGVLGGLMVAGPVIVFLMAATID